MFGVSIEEGLGRVKQGQNQVRGNLFRAKQGDQFIKRISFKSSKSLEIHVVVFSIQISILLQYFFELFYWIAKLLYLVALGAV